MDFNSLAHFQEIWSPSQLLRKKENEFALKNDGFSLTVDLARLNSTAEFFTDEEYCSKFMVIKILGKLAGKSAAGDFFEGLCRCKNFSKIIINALDLKITAVGFPRCFLRSNRLSEIVFCSTNLSQSNQGRFMKALKFCSALETLYLEDNSPMINLFCLYKSLSQKERPLKSLSIDLVNAGYLDDQNTTYLSRKWMFPLERIVQEGCVVQKIELSWLDKEDVIILTKAVTIMASIPRKMNFAFVLKDMDSTSNNKERCFKPVGYLDKAGIQLH